MRLSLLLLAIDKLQHAEPHVLTHSAPVWSKHGVLAVPCAGSITLTYFSPSSPSTSSSTSTSSPSSGRQRFRSTTHTLSLPTRSDLNCVGASTSASAEASVVHLLAFSDDGELLCAVFACCLSSSTTRGAEGRGDPGGERLLVWRLGTTLDQAQLILDDSLSRLASSGTSNSATSSGALGEAGEGLGTPAQEQEQYRAMALKCVSSAAFSPWSLDPQTHLPHRNPAPMATSTASDYAGGGGGTIALSPPSPLVFLVLDGSPPRALVIMLNNEPAPSAFATQQSRDATGGAAAASGVSLLPLCASPAIVLAPSGSTEAPPSTSGATAREQRRLVAHTSRPLSASAIRSLVADIAGGPNAAGTPGALAGLAGQTPKLGDSANSTPVARAQASAAAQAAAIAALVPSGSTPAAVSPGAVASALAADATTNATPAAEASSLAPPRQRPATAAGTTPIDGTATATAAWTVALPPQLASSSASTVLSRAAIGVSQRTTADSEDLVLLIAFKESNRSSTSLARLATMRHEREARLAAARRRSSAREQAASAAAAAADAAAKKKSGDDEAAAAAAAQAQAAAAAAAAAADKAKQEFGGDDFDFNVTDFDLDIDQFDFLGDGGVSSKTTGQDQSSAQQQQGRQQSGEGEQGKTDAQDEKKQLSVPDKLMPYEERTLRLCKLSLALYGDAADRRPCAFLIACSRSWTLTRHAVVTTEMLPPLYLHDPLDDSQGHADLTLSSLEFASAPLDEPDHLGLELIASQTSTRLPAVTRLKSWVFANRRSALADAFQALECRKSDTKHAKAGSIVRACSEWLRPGVQG